MAGSSGTSSWADEEAEFTPSFQAPSSAAPSSSMGAWMSGAASTGASSGAFTMGAAAQAPVPDSPPYTCRVGNVSYDVTEQIVHEFFSKEHGLPVESVRLPRFEDGRIRGSAFVDFTTRDGLVAALKLSGSQILGRTVSMNTVEQRGAPGGFGGGSFDWSRRATTGPTDGSGLGSGDRFDRFRPKNTRPEEPALNWGSRAGPTDGSGLGSFRREPREPREPRESREPVLNWGSRAGPTDGSGLGSFRREPREPRQRREQPTESFDWSRRAEPATGSSARPQRAARPQREQPSLDWGRRETATHSRSASRGTSAVPAPAAPAASSAAPTQQKKADPKLARLQRGFNALQIDDDEEDEAKSAAVKPATEAKSIGEIQEQQRATTGEGWSSV